MGSEPPRQLRARMLALSFLMLFVELALIRWTGSNILYLSYFSNFILLASFLGIGLGFLRADARRAYFPLLQPALPRSSHLCGSSPSRSIDRALNSSSSVRWAPGAG